MASKITLLLIIFTTSISAADYNFTIQNGKYYLTTKGPNGPIFKEVTVEIMNLDNSVPNPPTNPNPPNPSPNPTEPTDPFELKIAQLTEQVIKNGGTKTTAAGLSSAYSIVADNILSGEIPFDKALTIIPVVTNRVLRDETDKNKWITWKSDISKALQTLQQEGHLSTKEKFASTLKSVCRGMDYVSGFNGDTKRPAELHSKKSAGILGNIDIERLIEIIKFIMELIKLFSGGF